MLALLVLAGCGATPAQREVGQRGMQRISDEVRSMDGVTEVESGYQTTSAAFGIVGIVVTVRPGTAAESLLDAMERLVWTSCLDPLGSIALVVNEEGAPPNSLGVQRSYPTEADREALARKYGPRPVC